MSDYQQTIYLIAGNAGAAREEAARRRLGPQQWLHIFDLRQLNAYRGKRLAPHSPYELVKVEGFDQIGRGQGIKPHQVAASRGF